MHSRPPSYHRPYDAETTSLHSTAPSYTSSLPPTYTPLPPATQKYTSLLPSSSYTQIHSWPSLQLQSQAYMNVAARRARREQEARDTAAVERVLGVQRMGVLAERVEEVEGVAAGGGDEERALREERRAWDFWYGAVNKKSAGVVRRERRGRWGRWGFYGRLGG